MSASYTAYCVMCRKKIQTKNPKRAMSKNGKHAYLMGKCPKCGGSVSIRRLVTHEGGQSPMSPKHKSKKIIKRMLQKSPKKKSGKHHKLSSKKKHHHPHKA